MMVHLYKHYVSGHYPSSCLYLKHRPVYISKHNVSETGSCLRLEVKPTQLGPIDRGSPYLRTPAPTQDRVYNPSTVQSICKKSQNYNSIQCRVSGKICVFCVGNIHRICLSRDDFYSDSSLVQSLMQGKL
jgi:hypothetical protein